MQPSSDDAELGVPASSSTYRSCPADIPIVFIELIGRGEDRYADIDTVKVAVLL
jgi:hypothetical protein